MGAGRITDLRLTAFKSFRDITMPLEPLTVIIGRNGSGKSNALDALEVLSGLARGDEVRDAIEGKRHGSRSVRGGLDGCAPHGSDTFALGVTLLTSAGEKVTLDVTIQVSPTVQVVAEKLRVRVGGRWRTLLKSDPPSPHHADIDASVWNGKKGPDPHTTFRSSHLLTTQLPLRLPGKSENEATLLAVAEETLATLGGIFHLDPVPHLMRQYVPEQDNVLSRTADNLSAAVAHLQKADRERFTKLLEVVRLLPEYEVRSLEIGRGGYGDVMLALKERMGVQSVPVPARQMSDGMLRMLAIVTALLSGGRGLAIEPGAQERPGALMLVIEELENGLHPSQAAELLRLVTQQSDEQGFQVVLTTHSPALLNALKGDQHPGVIVVQRERTSGRSTATRLVDLPGYLRMMATSPLGEAVTAGRLADAAEIPAPVDERELDRILGIST